MTIAWVRPLFYFGQLVKTQAITPLEGDQGKLIREVLPGSLDIPYDQIDVPAVTLIEGEPEIRINDKLG